MKNETITAEFTYSSEKVKKEWLTPRRELEQAVTKNVRLDTHDRIMNDIFSGLDTYFTDNK
jgi:hypothetical protein